MAPRYLVYRFRYHLSEKIPELYRNNRWVNEQRERKRKKFHWNNEGRLVSFHSLNHESRLSPFEASCCVARSNGISRFYARLRNRDRYAADSRIISTVWMAWYGRFADTSRIKSAVTRNERRDEIYPVIRRIDIESSRISLSP